MTATLVFGGTFDPVHFGHLRSAKALTARFDDARLVMVPCKIPPHRPQPVASGDQRLAMLQLAVEEEQAITVDDGELKRQGKSFTFDTLSSYRDMLGDEPLYFIMGSDAWVTLPSWYRWQELTDLAHLIVLTRPGEDMAEPEPLRRWAASRETALEAVKNKTGNIVKLTLDQVDVSATGVRTAIETGSSIAEYCPRKVIQYIEANALYANVPEERSTEKGTVI